MTGNGPNHDPNHGPNHDPNHDPEKPLDMAVLRELAAELGYWPATTDAQTIARCRQIAEGRTLTERTLSPADAALRERIAELSVHIRCGGIRGPIQRTNPYRPNMPILWQSCSCEDSPERWPGADVSSEKDLCIICFRATAGGPSRWAWRACPDCRAINEALGTRLGAVPFAVGRHSTMNGIAVRGGQSAEVTDEQIARLLTFLRGDSRLSDWRGVEYRRLASVFDPDSDVTLSEWQRRWPPGSAASVAAFELLMAGVQSPQ